MAFSIEVICEGQFQALYKKGRPVTAETPEEADWYLRKLLARGAVCARAVSGRTPTLIGCRNRDGSCTVWDSRQRVPGSDGAGS